MSHNIEVAADIHNRRRSLIQALEEVGRRGYGRVVIAREEDVDGRVLRRQVIYRVSQANAHLAEAQIVSRNSKLGSEIASCEVGDDVELVPQGAPVFGCYCPHQHRRSHSAITADSGH